jgi:hypothetical protein
MNIATLLTHGRLGGAISVLTKGRYGASPIVVTPIPPTTGVLVLALQTQAVAMTVTPTSGILATGSQTTGILEVL